MKIKLTKICLIFLLFLNFYSFAFADLRSLIKNSGTNVIFLRHAIAPGFGDPDNFEINNCDTQRNLDQAGKKQALKIGKYLKEQKIKFNEILTSEWCRCKETAIKMNIGKWKTFSGLNSFFQNHANKNKVLDQLNTKLNKLKKNNLTLMISHQVVIFEITGIATKSGGLVLYNTNSKKTTEIIIK